MINADHFFGYCYQFGPKMNFLMQMKKKIKYFYLVFLNIRLIRYVLKLKNVLDYNYVFVHLTDHMKCCWRQAEGFCFFHCTANSLKMLCSAIVIIWLMLSLWLGTKVITLSGFHCTCELQSNLCTTATLGAWKSCHLKEGLPLGPDKSEIWTSRWCCTLTVVNRWLLFRDCR